MRSDLLEAEFFPVGENATARPAFSVTLQRKFPELCTFRPSVPSLKQYTRRFECRAGKRIVPEVKGVPRTILLRNIAAKDYRFLRPFLDAGEAESGEMLVIQARPRPWSTSLVEAL